jgi:hypothetical protein
MADKESIDVLMTFLDSNGNPVAAEGTSIWDKTDTTMMKDFQQGYFFEADDFTFSISLGGSEDGGESEGNGGVTKHSKENQVHPKSGQENASVNPNAARKANRSSRRFSKYVETGEAMDFKPEIQEITITKQMDISSIRFLKSCLTYSDGLTSSGAGASHKKFQKAVLVKRKFTGRSDFHEAFLRLEFKEPLITGVEWDEGDIIREKLKFVCRGVTAAYRPQNADGTLGDARSATWIPQRKLAGG